MSSLRQWHLPELRWNEVSDDEIKDMQDILNARCKGLCDGTDKPLVVLCALGRKKRMDLVQHVESTYSRMLIQWYISNNNVGEEFTNQHFIDNCEWIQRYKESDKKLFDAFKILLPICLKRLFCAEPTLNNIPFVLRDDVNVHIEIHRAVQHAIARSSKETSVLNEFIVRLDVVIIPKDVEAKGTINDLNQQIDFGDLRNVFEDEESEDDDDYDDDDDDIDDVYHYQLEHSQNISWINVVKHVLTEGCRYLDIENLNRRERYILVIDRREKYSKTCTNIYLYEVPEKFEQRLPRDCGGYLSVLNFYYSKKYLFPTAEGRVIGLYERSFNIWAVSYLMNEINDIKAYCYSNGSQLRFAPSDMIDIWPRFFDSSFRLTQKKIVGENEAYLKDLYPPHGPGITENEPYVNGLVHDQAHRPSVATQQIVETRDMETFAYETVTTESESMEGNVDTLCKYIEQEMGDKWSDFISQVIKIIEEAGFDEIDQIEDDIDDVDDSSIFEDFRENKPFQQELKGVIEAFIKKCDETA